MSDQPQAQDAATDGYFLSYSRSDERFALRFAKDLRARGVSLWVDQLDIRPSEHWDRAIERAVANCRGLIVILSPRSVASDNVADEISFAIDSGKSVLPVMIEKCTPPLRITRMHMIDATSVYDKAVQQCLAEIERAQGGGPVRAAAAKRGNVDAATVQAAKKQLSSLLGPIAGILVDNAAARAGSTAELYSLLVQHIDDESDRQRFLALTARGEAPAAPAAEQPRSEPKPTAALPAEDVDRLSSALTRHLGPIARVLVKRESQSAGSLDDLQQRVAALIPHPGDRADFLRQMAKA